MPAKRDEFPTAIGIYGMPIKVKRLTPNAKLPEKKTKSAAGFDIYATEVDYSRLGQFQILYKTGLSLEIPEGYVGLIYPRSSIRDTPLSLSNGVGVIDSDYRGEITFTFNYAGILESKGGYAKKLRLPKTQEEKIYKPGDRIGQLVVTPIPLVYYEEVQVLNQTERGTRGHGSTGRSE